MICDYFLFIHIDFSKQNFSVPRNMTADIDNAGKSGYMRRISLNVNRKRGCIAAKALWSKTESVYLRKRFFFKISVKRVCISPVHRTGKRLFRDNSRHFKCAAQTYAQNYRRTGI